MPDNENEELTGGTQEENPEETQEEENPEETPGEGEGEDEGDDDEEEPQSMTAVITKRLVEQVFTFEPDELISGSEIGFGMYDAVLRTQGEYKRGELLMLDDNQYVKATSAGLTTTTSLVILADNIEVGEEEYAEVMVYTQGRFMGSRIILPYETDSDSHDELIAALKPILLPYKIYID